MGLIVDANKAATVFGRPAAPESVPIHQWLENGGLIVYGGALTTELRRLHAARRVLLELQAAGRARNVDLTHASRITAETRRVSGSCRSDDPHVLALACATGARVLFSGDKRLIADFKDRDLIPNPRGKVYKDASNRGVLAHCRGCLVPP